MTNRFLVSIVLVFATSTATALAQNSNSSQTVRPRTTNTPSNTNQATTEPTKSPAKAPADGPSKSTTQTSTTASTAKSRAAAADTTASQSVIAAFNKLINGIRHADVNAVSNVYWNAPRLILFNNNGSVTKGWEQMRRNRESSYREMKDIKLDVRDISITMLGRDGAVVTCLWTQSQTFRGAPETASGRMTLVFKRVGKDWKAIHLHTSPDRPEPTRVLPSEQPTSSSVSPNP